MWCRWATPAVAPVADALQPVFGALAPATGPATDVIRPVAVSIIDSGAPAGRGAAPGRTAPVAAPDFSGLTAFGPAQILDLTTRPAQAPVSVPDRSTTLEAPAGVAGAGSGSGAAASAPVPPPGAVTAVLVLLLCLSTAVFGRLVLASARWRPVAFVSLLERPG